MLQVLRSGKHQGGILCRRYLVTLCDIRAIPPDTMEVMTQAWLSSSLMQVLAFEHGFKSSRTLADISAGRSSPVMVVGWSDWCYICA